MTPPATPLIVRRRILVTQIAALLVAVAPLSHAASYTYTGGGAGTALDPVSGSFATGFTPTFSNNDPAAILSFGGRGTSQYTATSADQVRFLELDLNSSSSNSQTIAANLRPAAGAKIVQSGAGGFILNGLLFADGDLSIEGSGSGPLVFSQEVNVSSGTLQKSGSHTTTVTGSFRSRRLSVSQGVFNLDGGVTNPTYIDPMFGFSGLPAMLNASGSGTININSPLTLQSLGPASFSIIANNGGVVNVRADIAAGAFNVTTDSTLKLSGAGRLTPATATVRGGGALILDNTASPESVDRLQNNLALRLEDSEVRYVGHADGSTESSGQVTFAMNDAIPFGSSTITVASQSSSAPTYLTFASLEVRPGAIGLIRGTALGASGPGGGVANVYFTSAPAFTGSTVSTETANRGILPNVLADNSASGLGTGFATYDSTRGVRLLRAGEFASGLAAAASGDNVISQTLETGVASKAANSLQFRAGGGASLLPGATLTINSGGLLFQPGNMGLTGGTLQTPSAAAGGLLIWTPGSPGDVTTIASALSGAAGFTKNGGGALRLAGVTNLGGDILVREGALQLGAGAPFSTSGTLTLGGASTFELNGAQATVGGIAGGRRGATAVNLGAGRLTISGGTAGYLPGNIVGSPQSVLEKNGAADLTLGAAGFAASMSSFGALVVNGGSVTLDAKLDAAVVVNRLARLVISTGALVGSSQVIVNPLAQVRSGGGLPSNIASSITLNGGTLLNPFSNLTVTHEVGVLNLAAGDSALQVNADTGARTAYRAMVVQRAAGTTLNVSNPLPFSSPFGTTARLGLGNVATGTGGMTVDASVVPYLLVSSNNSPGDLAFHQAGDLSGAADAGVRALTPAESLNFLSDQAEPLSNRSNYYLSTTGTIASNSKIGTLRLGNGGNVTGAGTLTIDTNSNGSANASVIMAGGVGSAPNTISVSTLAFGSKEAIFHVLDGTTADDLYISSNLTGTGGLTKSSRGTMVLIGNNSGLTGTITVANGVLKVPSPSALAARNSVTVTEQGTLDLSGAPATISSLSDGLPAAPVAGSTLTGGRVTSTSAAVLTIGDERNESSSFSGVIAGPLTLHKKGSGVLALSGANTYTGPTRVFSGVLAVQATGKLSPSAAIQVDREGTLDLTATTGACQLGAAQTLSGSGQVLGAIGGAGQIAPGPDAAILRLGAVDPQTGLDFAFTFNQLGSPSYGSAESSGNDTLRLTSSTPFAFTLTSGNSISIDVSALAGQLTRGDIIKGGFFAPLDFGASLAAGAFNFIGLPSAITGFTVSVVQETAAFQEGQVEGYVMQLTAVPEPASLTYLLLAATTLGSRMWRRRR